MAHKSITVGWWGVADVVLGAGYGQYCRNEERMPRSLEQTQGEYGQRRGDEGNGEVNESRSGGEELKGPKV